MTSSTIWDNGKGCFVSRFVTPRESSRYHASMPSDLPLNKYAKQYRQAIGFTRQKDARDFLGAKDIVAGISFEYIDQLLDRVQSIIRTCDKALSVDTKPAHIDEFLCRCVTGPYEAIRDNELLPRMNNQGRRPEEVLFSWLRGYAVAEYFLPSLAHILLATETINTGDDDFNDPERFRRSPSADYLLKRDGQDFRIEVQSGFQSISDIKQHKVFEAQRLSRVQHLPTVCVHLDLFNGQCAFVRLDTIDDGDINWISRQQMEGQRVFNIDAASFQWRLLDPPPSFDELELDL